MFLKGTILNKKFLTETNEVPHLREILKQERIKKGLTQQELANLVGISRVHYTQIENNSGNKKPSLDVAMGIKKVLGYSCDDLFSVASVPDKNYLL